MIIEYFALGVAAEALRHYYFPKKIHRLGIADSADKQLSNLIARQTDIRPNRQMRLYNAASRVVNIQQAPR